MTAQPKSEEFSDGEELLLEVFAGLNQVGAAINQASQAGRTDAQAVLTLIVESAIKVVPGASAIIYPFNPERGVLELERRVAATPAGAMPLGGSPRPNGMGMRAIQQQRQVLSYEELDLEIHPARVEAGVRTVACFPLVVGGQPLGVLYVYLHEDRPFSRLELLLLENFVNLAAMAIYQARQSQLAQQSLDRKEDELARLRRAGLLISSRLRLQDTLKAILDMAMDMTGARYGIFRLLDRGGQYLVTAAIAGEHLARPQVEVLPVAAQSVMSWVAKHRQPARIYDLRQEPWRQIYYPLDASLEMRSELAAPLVGASGRLEGVLNLESPQVGAFSEDDSHLLQALATQAVIAIQEARLLDSLQEVAGHLLNQPADAVLERLVELACDLLNASASAIWKLDSEQECLLLQASVGFSQQASLQQASQNQATIPLHDHWIGKAVLSHLPAAFQAAPAAEAGVPGASAIVVPLLAGDDNQPVGAFSIYASRRDTSDQNPPNQQEIQQFGSEWDIKVLTCLAHYAALAVRNTARQQELRTVQDQRAVAETFAVVGDIAANLLHKLNNKVGAIPVRVQGIQDKSQAALQSDAYLAANLAEIERSAAEAMEAVRENLALLRPIHLTAVNVEKCVRLAIQQASLGQGTLQQGTLPSGLQFHLIGIDQLPPVKAGEHSLVLVLANLIENAAEEMAGQGEITIRGRLKGSAANALVEVAVSDNGPGIPAHLQERIFQFNYSGRTASRPHKLGFGLWWVKTVMARLGGSVELESDGQHGATFYLYLPRMVGS
jgi:signal transduction histidine kinase/putative methionine-R-sulfoxide reductase with GAF domain